MPVITESSSEHMKWRRTRSHLIQPISETDPILQPRSCKPTTTISSLLLSSFSNEASPSSSPSSSSSFSTKKKTAIKFRGLGCTASASQQVSVPAVIRSSADWDGGDDKKVKKNKKKKEKTTNEKSQVGAEGLNPVVACMDFQDVWCGPGAGFSGESGDGSVDCVVARRNVNSGRGKIDGDHHHIRMNSHHHRERVCLTRRTVSPDTISFLDSEPEFLISRPGSEVFGRRCYQNVRHASPEGLAEIMMFQSSLMMGGRLDIDRYREWRLDVDNMTYEQLLELGERIGYVSTGLAKDEIRRCVQKIKLSTVGDQVKNGKCIICQEEYESDDVEGEEMGKVLNCGHVFHFECIEQWLAHKNTCPFCKVEAATKC